MRPFSETSPGEKLRRRLDIPEGAPFSLWVVPWLHCQPGDGVYRDGPIMINGTTARPSSGVWNHPREHIRANDMSLRLIEFFDWGTLDYRDWKLLRVEIAASTAYPDVVGREGLLEVSSVKVLAFADTQLPGSLAAAIVDLHAAIP